MIPPTLWKQTFSFNLVTDQESWFLLKLEPVFISRAIVHKQLNGVFCMIELKSKWKVSQYVPTDYLQVIADVKLAKFASNYFL